MKYSDHTYIWQASDWPHWRYDLQALIQPLTEISHAQGLLLGRLADVGLSLRDQASLTTLTDDVLKTSEIEGEQLNAALVRTSIARRLGVDIGAMAAVDSHVEGIVDMVLDAIQNNTATLTEERLFGWRDDAHGAMQVVSVPMGRQRERKAYYEILERSQKGDLDVTEYLAIRRCAT